MRMNIFFIILFGLSLGLTFITIFCPDSFLFFIHGYDKSLINSNTMESFKAHKNIALSKQILLFGTFIISLIVFSWSIYLKNKSSSYFYEIATGLVFATSIILTIIVILYFIMPKRVI